MARILIVDDSALARKLLRKIFMNIGHEIVGEAENGESSFIEYKKLKPDIVTMDLDMPGIGGLKAANTIMKQYPDAKVIIVSAHEVNDLIEEMKRYELKYHIIKPVTEAKAIDAIKMIMSTDSAVPENNPSNKIEPKSVQSGPFRNGNLITVSHYSRLRPFRGTVDGFTGDILAIKTSHDCTLHSFFEDDPIVVGYESKEGSFICECSIIELQLKNNIIKIKIEKTENLKKEKLVEDFPTSLSVDIRMHDSRKKSSATIKKIGYYNITAKSTFEFSPGEQVWFDISMNSKILSVNAKVESKTSEANNFVYVFKPMFDSYEIKRNYTTQLQMLLDEQEKALKELKVI